MIAAAAVLTNLRDKLDDLQAIELDKVGKAVDLLIELSNHVELPEPDAPPPEGKTAEQWNKELAERYCFVLMRGAAQEAEIDFNFLAVSLLAEKDFEAWQNINPFLKPEEQAAGTHADGAVEHKKEEPQGDYRGDQEKGASAEVKD